MRSQFSVVGGVAKTNYKLGDVKVQLSLSKS